MALEGGQTVIVDACMRNQRNAKAIAVSAPKRPVLRSLEFGSTRPPETMRRKDRGPQGGHFRRDTSRSRRAKLTDHLGPQSFSVVDASLPLVEVVASCLRVIRDTHG